MIIAFQNSTETLWLPVFSLNDRVYESPIYTFFAVLQFLIYIATAFIIVRTCKIFLAIKIFHENKNFLMAFFLFQWFEAILAKMVILPYQIGLVTFGNTPGKSYFSWWSCDQQDMAFIKSTDEILPLYLASYVFRHYMFSMLGGIMAIGCERACATFYIQDYEHVRRRHIPVLLIIGVNLFSIPYCYFVIHNEIPFMVIYGHWALCIVMVLVGYLVILKINIVFRNKLEKCEVGEYTLARKFQVEENIRSLKIARKSVIVIMVYIFLTLLVFTCLMMGVFVDYKTVFVHILENFIVLPALIMSISLLMSSNAWSDQFLKGLPFIEKHYRKPRVGAYDFRQKQSIYSESELYFEQLKSSWKC